MPRGRGRAASPLAAGLLLRDAAVLAAALGVRPVAVGAAEEHVVEVGADYQLGDGQTTAFRGRTPAELALAPGSYVIGVELPGYIPVSQSIAVEPGARPEVDFPLEKLAALRVEADVEGATVRLEDDAPEPAPFRRALRAGSYRVRVVAAGHREVSRQVASWRISFERTPRDRIVYMDGRPHPGPNAPHTWTGFSTGVWIGDILKITTTHLKEGYIRRNGVPASDERTFTEYLMRRDNGFQAATWEECLDFTVGRIRDIQGRYGKDAVAIYGGASLSTEKSYLMGKFARVALGTRHIDYNGRLCMVSAGTAYKLAFGVDRSTIPWSEIPKAEVLFVIGANVGECAPITTDYIWRCRDNGGRLIVMHSNRRRRHQCRPPRCPGAG